MAIRPVYFVDEDYLCRSRDIYFEWFSGFSSIQKKKAISSFHSQIQNNFNCLSDQILEISTKSSKDIGINLSAFNLMLTLNNMTYSVENWFQSSKVFEEGGPYYELLKASAKEAKTSQLIRESGNLIGFVCCEESWGITPKTQFYDWLYINAVHQNQGLVSTLLNYSYFTDIEFNPKKSINCQARSASLYVSLHRQGKIDDVISNINLFKDLYKENQTSLFD